MISGKSVVVGVVEAATKFVVADVVTVVAALAEVASPPAAEDMFKVDSEVAIEVVVVGEMVVNAKWNFKSDVKDVAKDVVEYVVRDMQVSVLICWVSIGRARDRETLEVTHKKHVSVRKKLIEKANCCL
ncbi:23045_t:CDS:2 [Entrophospora sp. SA101]|nr:23041_t:CDS:2 [Entrophospora sp. SA101]CAJ0758023.1 23045_t:CDS:2 [Entrophospora sp. SA101]